MSNFLQWIFLHHYILIIFGFFGYVFALYLRERYNLNNHSVFKKQIFLANKIDRVQFKSEYKTKLFVNLLQIKREVMFNSMIEIKNSIFELRNISNTEFETFIFFSIRKSFNQEKEKFYKFLYDWLKDTQGVNDVVFILDKNGYYKFKEDVLNNLIIQAEAIVKNKAFKTRRQKLNAVLNIIDSMLFDTFTLFIERLKEVNGELDKKIEISLSRYKGSNLSASNTMFD